MFLPALADAAGSLFLGIPLVFVVLVILGSIFWLWMLIDAIQNPRLKDLDKIIWVLVVLFLHFVGAVVYYFVGRGGPSTGAAS